MYATYRLNTDELTNTFIDDLKATFHSQEIAITVKALSKRPAKPDTTELLLSNPIDRERILASVAAHKAGKPPYRTFTEEEFEALSKELLAK
jgi:hypothetical protein